MAALYWGFLLNFAFLFHSCFMTQSSNASHSSRLLFPPRNHFQVTCLGHFPPAQLLTFAHLPVTLRAQTWEMACAELRELWALPLPVRLCLGQRSMGKWCCGRNFYLQTRLFHPCTPPLSQPLRGENAEEGWLAGSDPKLLFDLSLPQPLAHPGVLPCVGIAAYCFSTRPTQRLASSWGWHSPLHGDLTPGSISCPSDCFHPVLLALEIWGVGGVI